MTAAPEYRWKSDNGKNELRLSFEGEELVVTKDRRARRLPVSDITGFFVRDEPGGPRLYMTWKSSDRANTMRERCTPGDELSAFLNALATRTPKGADLRGSPTEQAPVALRVATPTGLWIAVIVAAVVVAVGLYLSTRR